MKPQPSFDSNFAALERLARSGQIQGVRNISTQVDPMTGNCRVYVKYVDDTERIFTITESLLLSVRGGASEFGTILASTIMQYAPAEFRPSAMGLPSGARVEPAGEALVIKYSTEDADRVRTDALREYQTRMERERQRQREEERIAAAERRRRDEAARRIPISNFNNISLQDYVPYEPPEPAMPAGFSEMDVAFWKTLTRQQKTEFAKLYSMKKQEVPVAEINSSERAITFDETV